jgi:hypothetical protein
MDRIVPVGSACAWFCASWSAASASKAYATGLAHRKDSADMKVGATALLASEESLRKARRERLKAVSDEALYDLDSYTVKIIAKRK